MSKTYILHHRDSDGYCAALAAYVAGLTEAWQPGNLANAIYVDVQYGEAFPNIELTDKDRVYILDFSYDRVTLDAVNAKVKDLVVIDHHKTAAKALQGAPYAIFDMTKSGSDLAWEYFHGQVPMNWLLQLVSEYDMGVRDHKEAQWLENTMVAHPRKGDLAFWKKIMDDPVELQEVLEIGKGIQFNNDQILRNIVEKKYYKEIQWSGYRGAVVNSAILRNEIAYAVLDARPDLEFVCTTRIFPSGQMKLALRARKEDEHIDISTIAEYLGGGGHRASSSVVVSLSQSLALQREWYSV